MKIEDWNQFVFLSSSDRLSLSTTRVKRNEFAPRVLTVSNPPPPHPLRMEEKLNMAELVPLKAYLFTLILPDVQRHVQEQYGNFNVHIPGNVLIFIHSLV